MNKSMKITVAALSGLLMLGSMNVASEAAPGTSGSTAAAVSKVEQLEKEETARINKLLEDNPDDTYMVYVSNELTKGKRLETFAMGNTHPEYNTYEDYWKKASTLQEPVLKQPKNLPENYRFVSGEIVGPYSSEYHNEMKAEAKKLKKQVHSKKVNWTKSNMILLHYKNGTHYIKFQSARLDPKDKKQKGYTYITAEELKKKYPKLGKKFITNTLSWIENGKSFSISTNPGNPLKEEDLIKMAKTVVKK